jgi:hypothetical protein
VDGILRVLRTGQLRIRLQASIKVGNTLNMRYNRSMVTICLSFSSFALILKDLLRYWYQRSNSCSVTIIGRDDSYGVEQLEMLKCPPDVDVVVVC